MKTCTFFGHSENCSLSEETLTGAIENLIGEGIDTFYVGNQGQFDALVRRCLKKLRILNPHIRFYVVLAYLPAGKTEGMEDTLFPEGLEIGPPRFAIDRRNRWMIAHATHCLCWVNHTWGGAWKYARMAARRGLKMVNLGKTEL